MNGRCGATKESDPLFLGPKFKRPECAAHVSGVKLQRLLFRQLVAERRQEKSGLIGLSVAPICLLFLSRDVPPLGSFALSLVLMRAFSLILVTGIYLTCDLHRPPLWRDVTICCVFTVIFFLILHLTDCCLLPPPPHLFSRAKTSECRCMRS